MFNKPQAVTALMCYFMHVCAADLWDVVLEELRVWLSVNHGSVYAAGGGCGGGGVGVGEHTAAVSRGRTQIPTRTSRDDARGFSCQVDGT